MKPFTGLSCPPLVQPGDPLRGLTADELARFEKGREVFECAFTPETGPGAVFNADDCGECHEDPVAARVLIRAARR